MHPDIKRGGRRELSERSPELFRISGIKRYLRSKRPVIVISIVA